MMGFELPKANGLVQQLFAITNEKEFAQIALDIFRYQYLTNPVYQSWCEALKKDPDTVQQAEQIPFLPIQFFKTQQVKASDFVPEVVFTSSGTTGTSTSRHFIKDLSVYRESFFRCFEMFYGRPQNFCVLGLLPSYLEKGESSLVYMVDALIEASRHPLSGFYLYEHQKLAAAIQQLESTGQPTILFGVSYALLDFADAFPMPLKNTTIIETGGMKGRKKEITKPELYSHLRQAFSTAEIQSEYGMTELLSQAYAINGLYKPPPWLKVLLRDETDPLFFNSYSGAINVIDLANIFSCSFIATDDRGKMHPDGSFEVLGRIDNSDIRGCSQLIEPA